PAGAEDALQLVGRRDVELIVAAVLRPLVGTPADELCGVAEAAPLHVVVRDLAHAFGAEWHPAQILAAIPAAARAGQPLPLGLRLGLGLRPVAPGMIRERVTA